jgi:polyisoprenoid-binding protein YceI
MHAASQTSLGPGTYRFGPENAVMSVRTGRGGAAAKAGHDLLIEVTVWEARLELGPDSSRASIELHADSRSLQVREGKGGMQALDAGDIANIHETITAEVLKDQEIVFRSTTVTPAPDGGLDVWGDLTLVGETHPVELRLLVDGDGRLGGKLVVTQSDWGIKPYSTLFGALKVADEVEVSVEAMLPASPEAEVSVEAMLPASPEAEPAP